MVAAPTPMPSANAAVTVEIAAQQAAAGVTAGTTVGAPMPAFIVGNDKAVDRFLKGGKAAFMDFINENKQSLKAMLGQ